MIGCKLKIETRPELAGIISNRSIRSAGAIGEITLELLTAATHTGTQTTEIDCASFCQEYLGKHVYEPRG